MEWKKIFNKKYDSKITISLKNYLKVMFRDRVDYDKIVYKVAPDYNNKKLVITFKHEK